MSDVETLAFAVREGATQNLFLRRGPVAAHLVATSGTAPRLLVAFPAGNTGAGLWFEARPEAVAVEVEGELTPVEEGAMRGVSATLVIDAPELRLARAVLGSVRAIRDFAHRGETAVGLCDAFDAGPPFTLSRTTIDGDITSRSASRRAGAPACGPTATAGSPWWPRRVSRCASR